METIGEIVTLMGRSRLQSARRSDISERPRLKATISKDFQKMFPSETAVLTFFAPSRWGGMLRNPAWCFAHPSDTLWVLANTYKGIDKTMCKNNIVGIYQLARPREAINDFALDTVADQFCAKFGNELTPWGMLWYMASYMTDYKSSFGFDLPDILRQCRDKYMPWYLTQMSKRTRKAEEQPSGITGLEAKYAYLKREYLDKGRDLRESPMYEYGYLTEEEIKIIESNNIAF